MLAFCGQETSKDVFARYCLLASDVFVSTALYESNPLSAPIFRLPHSVIVRLAVALKVNAERRTRKVRRRNRSYAAQKGKDMDEGRQQSRALDRVDIEEVRGNRAQIRRARESKREREDRERKAAAVRNPLSSALASDGIVGNGDFPVCRHVTECRIEVLGLDLPRKSVNERGSKKQARPRLRKTTTTMRMNDDSGTGFLLSSRRSLSLVEID